MAIRDELLDEILQDYDGKPESFWGKDGIYKELTKRLMERALAAEMNHHLGYSKYSPNGKNTGNSRNGSSRKTVQGDQGKIELEIPRDRNAEFAPELIKKGQRRISGMDDQILSLYGRGMTQREIRDHLEEMYSVEVSHELISSVTDAVEADIKEWRTRPLEPVYCLVYLDALFIKVRDNGHIRNKAVYFALGINPQGIKELLGIWIENAEGAKFWMKVLSEIRDRGVKDILIACVDGLKGFPEAIEGIFPKTQVQLCMVHMVRNSVKYVSFKERKEVCADLKKIYTSLNAEDAEVELDAFQEKWGEQYPIISKSWRNNWAYVVPLFDYPSEIRTVMYTTNAIESAHSYLRKVTKNRPSYPSDDAAIKLLYLAIQNLTKKWSMPVRKWKAAMNQFSVIFEDRISAVV
jgi:putative transposase